MKNQKKWCLLRHRILISLARFILNPFLRIKYGYKRKIVKGIPEPCLVLFNHQTSMDQFFVSLTLKRHIYVMTTNDVFSNGLLSKLLVFSCNPIPKNKSESDLGAIRTCLQVAKEGRTIAIAPEGNRTYTGELCDVNPAITKLAKILKLPIVILNIKGGHAVEPRWCKKVRKGKITCDLRTTLTKEEVASLSSDELYDIIVNSLTINQEVEHQIIKKDDRAEYLERFLFLCPKCHKIHSLESCGNKVVCQDCGLEATYLEDCYLSFNDPKIKIKSVADWDRYQREYLHTLPMDFLDKHPLIDNGVTIKQTVNKRKIILMTGQVMMNDKELTITSPSSKISFVLDDVSSMTCAGKHKLLFYHKNNTYQFVGDERFNPVKYMYFYYHMKNIRGGLENGEFLGI